MLGGSMKVKCNYCDSYISDTDIKCPNCSAPNAELKRVGDGVPRTIDELKLWYLEHNLPDESVTRFFIGKDYKESKAFGIYYDNYSGNYVVYKNKANGERTIRYEGKDEIYAVNELYMKLKEEILHQKSNNINKKSAFSSFWSILLKKNMLNMLLLIVIPYVLFCLIRISIINVDLFINICFGLIAIGVVLLFLSIIYVLIISIKMFIDCVKRKNIFESIVTFLFACLMVSLILIFIYFGGHFSLRYYYSRDDGYYNINGNTYYNLYNSWYIYDNGWKTSDLPVYDGNVGDYYIGESYTDNSGYTDFSETSYWKSEYGGGSSSSSSSSSSSDWDSGSSWDSSDSWDSSSTDWDSDW